MIKKVVVCGAGTMGAGIAQVVATYGFTTILFDINEAILETGKNNIDKSLSQLVAKQKISAEVKSTAISNLTFTTNINHCVGDFIIEAIVENLPIKVKLFKQLAHLNTAETILASNTSSIAIASIAKEISYPERVIGLHFFNPAPLMKLVEIITPNSTKSTVLTAASAFVEQLNKVAVVCKDSPGFIVNRVARPYYLEAMYLVENKLATIENVDALLENCGFKMGPFKLMDLIGLDINFSVSEIVFNNMQQPKRLTPSKLQQQKVEEGKLGKKTKEGFYKY